jgi:hypothetical protein
MSEEKEECFTSVNLTKKSKFIIEQKFCNAHTLGKIDFETT